MLIALGHDLQRIAELEGRADLEEPGVMFTAEECARFRRSATPAHSLAGAFACKEALFKALPQLSGGFWTDLEIVHDHRGAPRLRAGGAFAALLAREGWRVHLTISHSGEYASAVVAVVSEPHASTESGAAMLEAPDTLTIHVRPNDLDSLGHVNNAVALEYLEAGRWAWMDRHGLRRRGDVVAVVSRLEIDYRREITGAAVQVRTALVPGDLEPDMSYQARFSQQLLVPAAATDEAPALAVEAVVRVAFVRAATRELCTLHDFLAAAGHGESTKE